MILELAVYQPAMQLLVVALQQPASSALNASLPTELAAV